MLTNYNKCSFEDIIDDATEKGEEALSFVVAMAREKKTVTKTNKNGKEETKQVNKYPFITLKRAYFKKYYPELLPVAKTPKGKTMEDILKSRGL